MAKSKVGLPSGFSLNVKAPVELGDYLDETTERPRPFAPAKREPEARTEPQATKGVQAPLGQKIEKEIIPPETLEEPQPVFEVSQSSSHAVTPKLRDTGARVSSPSKKARKPVRRKQINMSPRTIERFADIVRHVQEYSPQADTAASEVMDAIISAHYEAMSSLRLGAVPARGRWGSPTAQAFKDALSRAFTNALIEHYQKVKP